MKLLKLGLNHYIYGNGHFAAYLVVRDPASGRKNVYTVHRISLRGDKAAAVIGRELDLPIAREIVKKDMLRL